MPAYESLRLFGKHFILHFSGKNGEIIKINVFDVWFDDEKALSQFMPDV
jgi:hypothetical protein